MDFFIRHKTIITFIAFTLFCIISLSIKSSSFTFTIEGIGNAFTVPFQKAYHGMQGGFSKLWKGYTELSGVKKELRATRKRLQKYESLTEEISELKIENRRLRRLLGLKERIQYDSIPAAIISKDPDNWFKTLIIDKGENDGIKVNMPVLAYQGGYKAVVGKIAEVRNSISRIVPIISPEMKLGVMFQETRIPGLLHGLSSTSNLCVIEYVSRSSIIKYGTVVITSGQGGVFPSGLLVGKVLKSDVLKSQAYQRIIIKPALDYSSIEEVFVVKKEPNTDLLNIFEGDK